MCWRRLDRIQFHFRKEETKAVLKGCKRVVFFKGYMRGRGLKYFRCGAQHVVDMK